VDENGQYQFVSHETNIGNIDITKIKGAYAVVVNKDDSRHLEVMTIDQIKKAWGQGAAKGNSGAHVNFTDQMCKKTIIARACKIALDSTSDQETDDSMTPPDPSEAVREQAQHALPKGTASGDDLLNNADFEEVNEGGDNGTGTAEPAPEPQPAAKPKRECPV